MKRETIIKSGNLYEYLDLLNREGRRVGYRGILWKDGPELYHFVAMICPMRKVTVCSLFHEEPTGKREFIGAGVAVRNPTDTFYEEPGLRLALSRALSTVNMHTGNGRNGKGKK